MQTESRDSASSIELLLSGKLLKISIKYFSLYNTEVFVYLRWPRYYLSFNKTTGPLLFADFHCYGDGGF